MKDVLRVIALIAPFAFSTAMAQEPANPYLGAQYVEQGGINTTTPNDELDTPIVVTARRRVAPLAQRGFAGSVSEQISAGPSVEPAGIERREVWVPIPRFSSDRFRVEAGGIALKHAEGAGGPHVPGLHAYGLRFVLRSAQPE